MVLEVFVAEDMVNEKVELDLLAVKIWSGVEEPWEGSYSDGSLFFRLSCLTILWDLTVLVLMDLTYFELCAGCIIV